MTAPTVERISLLGDASAVLSTCERYRYQLTRTWGRFGPTVTFVMLNPSTADETTGDPTVRRCVGFATREGAGRLVVVNLFALRSTDPAQLARADDPIGPGNDEHILAATRDAALVIAAWGAHPFAADRAADVQAMLAATGTPLHRIGPPSKDGHPRHPLYLAADTPVGALVTAPAPVRGDPATLRRPRRTVPRMRPHADPATPAAACTRPPAGYVCSLGEGHTGPCPAWPAATVRDGLPLVHVAVTVTCALRPSQEHPDVHVGVGHARTYLAALTDATGAATRAPIAAGVPFHVSDTRRY